MKRFCRSVLYYFKQLLPLTYRSHYLIAEGGENKPVFAVWRMWFGKVFAAEYWYTSGACKWGKERLEI
jgi:hypothetical protein